MDEQKIVLTHLNIRQSIAVLLIKLVVKDFVLFLLVLGIYWITYLTRSYLGIYLEETILLLILFGVVEITKISLSIYIVLQWLNEYYEITQEYIYHKKGLIFRKIDQFRIDHIRRINVKDSFFGELFNYATISLIGLRLNTLLDLNLIHNPARYIRVLKELNPEIEIERDKVRLPLMPKEKDKKEYGEDLDNQD